MFIVKHLEVLKETSVSTENWAGYKIRQYVESVKPQLEENQLLNSVDFDSFPLNEMNRQDVFKFVQDAKNSSLSCALSIFAWGAMRRSNARQVIYHSKNWLPVIERLRENPLKRDAVYDMFAELRSLGAKGMGPAYFTKLIYFLGRNETSRGYIMDQWTARSINLLCGLDLIHLSKFQSFQFVNDKNNGAVYEKFCACVEGLAQQLDVKPDEAELLIFSEGRSRGAWRTYVKENT